MVYLKDLMTTEMLRKKFNSSFALVNYAIALSHNIIKTGRPSKAAYKYENPALIALEEIIEGVDELVEFEDEDENQALQEAREAMAKKGLEIANAGISGHK
ncbi:MAG: hypothetical protein ACQEP8_01350 [Chlamydiota bacterium]